VKAVETGHWDDDLALAFELGRRAAAIALDFYDCDVATELKADGSPVTEADLAIESALLATLNRERPQDAILSEERGEIGTGQRRWIIDPLDGTSMFLDRTGGWGTFITLQDNGESVLALVTRPLDSRCWWAVRGEGAVGADLASAPVGAKQVTLSQARTISEARVAGWGPRSSREIQRLARLPEWTEPGTHSFDRLVDGELDVVVLLGGRVWDHAPCALIIEEAGGQFRDPRGGKRLDLLGGVYSNAYLTEHVGNLLGWY
jgi:histidinol-phosphatase